MVGVIEYHKIAITVGNTCDFSEVFFYRRCGVLYFWIGNCGSNFYAVRYAIKECVGCGTRDGI